MGHTVTVPESAAVRFPDLCVRCEATGPTAHHTLRGESSGWILNRVLGALIAALPDLRYDLPCCAKGCKACLRLRYWGVLFGISAWAMLLMVLLFGVGPSILNVDRAGHETALGLTFFALLFGAMLMVYVFFPPAVRLETSGGEATLTFRSRRVAEAFAAANGRGVS